MNIFIARLNYDTTNHDLSNAFEEFGEVSSAKIIMDKFTGQSKGYGFVEMPDEVDAVTAINELNGTRLDGRQIVVKKANAGCKERNRSYSYSW